MVERTECDSRVVDFNLSSVVVGPKDFSPSTNEEQCDRTTLYETETEDSSSVVATNLKKRSSGRVDLGLLGANYQKRWMSRFMLEINMEKPVTSPLSSLLHYTDLYALKRSATPFVLTSQVGRSY
jgi:hypothetical protein